MGKFDSNAVLERRNAGKNQPDEAERLYLDALLSSREGRWLIGNLCRAARFSEASPKDAYQSGRRDIIVEQVTSKIITHFGYAPFTELMKGKDDGRRE